MHYALTGSTTPSNAPKKNTEIPYENLRRQREGGGFDARNKTQVSQDHMNSQILSAAIDAPIL